MYYNFPMVILNNQLTMLNKIMNTKTNVRYVINLYMYSINIYYSNVAIYTIIMLYSLGLSHARKEMQIVAQI